MIFDAIDFANSQYQEDYDTVTYMLHELDPALKTLTRAKAKRTFIWRSPSKFPTPQMKERVDNGVNRNRPSPPLP